MKTCLKHDVLNYSVQCHLEAQRQLHNQSALWSREMKLSTHELKVLCTPQQKAVFSHHPEATRLTGAGQLSATDQHGQLRAQLLSC